MVNDQRQSVIPLTWENLTPALNRIALDLKALRLDLHAVGSDVVKMAARLRALETLPGVADALKTQQGDPGE